MMVHRHKSVERRMSGMSNEQGGSSLTHGFRGILIIAELTGTSNVVLPNSRLLKRVV